VENFFDVSSIHLTIQYNDSVMTFAGVENTCCGITFTETLSPGAIELQWSDATGSTPLNISSGQLAELHFSYHDGNSNLEFLTAQCDVRDSQNRLISVQYEDATVCPDLSEAVMYLMHDTGKMQLAIYNEGSIAADNATRSGPGIQWKGENGAYVGGLIFGTAERARINGLLGSFASLYQDLVQDFVNIESAFADGFTTDENFGQISRAVFSDEQASNPYGVKVIQKSLSKMNEDYVFLRYGFVNPTEATIEDFHAGLFIDWDINDYNTNLGAYDLADDLAYEYNSNANYYFGVAALSGLSGMKITERRTNIGDCDDIRRKSFEWISTIDQGNVTKHDDLRMWIGSSVGDIDPGDTAWVSFAIVAGNSVSEIKNNADKARARALSVCWTDVREKTSAIEPAGLPETYCLQQNYPNPFNPTTTIRYAIPKTEMVSITVFNLTGQRIETLVDKIHTPGVYSVNWNTSGICSGIYFYKLECEHYTKTMKMMLMK